VLQVRVPTALFLNSLSLSLARYTLSPRSLQRLASPRARCQDALELAANPAHQLPPDAQQLIESFTGLGGGAEGAGFALPADPHGPAHAMAASPRVDDERPRSEQEYDRMVEEMTARAWTVAWATYSVRSAASNHAAVSLVQQPSRPPPPHASSWQPHASHDGDGAMKWSGPSRQAPAGPRVATLVPAAESAARGGSPLAPCNACAPPPRSDGAQGARARNARSMASASLRSSKDTAVRCLPSGLQLSSSRGARHSARPSSYLQAHLVKQHRGAEAEGL